MCFIYLPGYVNGQNVTHSTNSSVRQGNTLAVKPGALISDTLLGTIVGGIIGFGSAIGASQIQYYITRPIISIKEETTEAYILNEPETPAKEINIDFSQLTQYRYAYHCTRITVENKGWTAAEDCKASLIIKHQQERVAWMIPNKDFTVIINAHDEEQIDLCAFYLGYRIFTTERGYQWNPSGELQGRPYLSPELIEAELKVSVKNAKQCTKKIWIRPSPDNHGKMVKFKREV